MASFLATCPRCGIMTPKGSQCENCHYSEHAEAIGMHDQQAALIFAQRQNAHTRNFAVQMVLMFATGLLGLLTAFLWFKVIYMGSLSAFITIGLLTVLTGFLGFMTAICKKILPVDLNCPCCDLRLDELGTNDGYCPSCNAHLK